MERDSMTTAVAAVTAAYEAIDARIDRGEPRGHGNEAFGSLSKLMTELRLDRASHPEPVEVATLTPEQRAVLTTLTEHWIELRGVSEVPSCWPCRRWLGLAPAGVLERRFGGALPADLDSALAELPTEERVEAGVEAMLARGSVGPSFFESLRRDAPAALGFARATLTLLPPLRTHVLVKVALFTAFSSSGVTVPEGVDAHFPLAYRLPGEPLSERVSTRFLVEHLNAVAESRRDEVLAQEFRRSQDGGKAEAALFLIEHCGPLPRSLALVAQALEHKKQQRLTGVEKKVVVELSRRVRALTASVRPRRAKPNARPH
jgi:hypothetical protein